MNAAEKNNAVIENKPPETLPNGNSELAAVVQESADTIGSAKIEPPKRGRGRPRGPNFQNGNYGKKIMSGGGPATSADGPTHSTTDEAAPPPDISEFLVPPLQAISTIPATKHQIPELALTEQEAKACANSIQQALNAFVPDLSRMSPKAAAILGLSITVGTIATSKLMIFATVKQQRMEELRKNQSIEDDLPPPPEHHQAPPSTAPPVNLAQNNPFGH